MEECSAAFVAFSYPDYPRELVDRFIRESEEAVKAAGVKLVVSEKVVFYKDAEKALASLRQSDWDLLIALIVSWVEAPNVIAVLKEFSHKPILLWSHTMFKEKGETLTLGAMPGAGVIRETLEQMGFKFKFIWGMPDEEDVKREIRSFARVAHAVNKLSKSKIGLLGYASMGMYTGTFDHVNVRAKIGPEIEHLDQYVVVKKMSEVDDREAEELVGKVKDLWEVSEKVTDEDLKRCMKMYLALKSIVHEFGWNALTVKCQYELSRYFGLAPCIPLSMLGDEVTCSCEGDMPLLITQLIMHYITGETTTYGDVHNIYGRTVLLGACGFAPFKLALGKPRVDKHTALYQGLLNTTSYRRGRVTLARLASDKDGYKMHIATGEADLPEPFHEVGCPPYPSMKVTIDGDAYHFGQHLMSQHYAIVYGDIKKELIDLCNLLNIKPVIS
jgi:L-fucose isomerase-like protein